MKKKTLTQVLTFVAIFSLIVALGSCKNGGENHDADTQDSSVVEEDIKVEETTKTRDELIINRQEMSFADPENPVDFELKHTPEITVGEKGEDGKTKISVIVGSEGIIHPETAEHWIDFLELKVEGENEIVELIEFENNEEAGKYDFMVNLEGAKTVTVTAGCNLHGIWKNQVEL